MAIDDNTSYELTGYQVKDLAQKIRGKADDDVFVGAGTSVAGSRGLVPAPAAGDNTKFLKGDGTWQAALEIVGTTTGDFNYAFKYADGRLVCFQRYSYTGKRAVSYNNVLYRVVAPYAPKNFAVEFTDMPTVEASYVDSVVGWNGWLERSFDNSRHASKTSPGEYNLVRTAGGENIDGVVDIVAYGFWK